MRTVIVFTVFVTLSQTAVIPSIPPHLQPCYRNGGPALTAPRRLDVFLSLIRRLELSTTLDMRLFTASLLLSLRLDGIQQSEEGTETEFVLPYRASAFQFHRYKLMMDLFIPSQNLINVDDVLNLQEKCLLHKMLSSSVNPWERGDESIVCPLVANQSHTAFTDGTTVNRRMNSRCPLEEGVVQTKWGTISAGTLVAAIAGALEEQSVSVNDILNANVFKADISEPLIVSAQQEWFPDIETNNNAQKLESVDIGNLWVATLAGDLAEVVVNQGRSLGASGLLVGSNHRWNDTMLPRVHYHFTRDKNIPDWHFTDAEILAGIDGLIIANHMQHWINQRSTLRLSQVIDMYYSNNGIAFTPTVKACNRQTLFTDVFRREDLLLETSRFAHILSLRQGGVYVPLEELNKLSEVATAKFVEYLSNIFQQNHQDCKTTETVPLLNMVVATDSSWHSYAVEQFISWIGGAIELDGQSSTLSLLHGNTGHWIVPPSQNLTAVFAHINNYTNGWPNRLNLPNVISSVMQHSLNNSLEETRLNASAALATLILLISPSDRLSSNDLERSRDLMSTLRASYFDVYFAYASSDLTDFQNINNEYLDYSELFSSVESSNVRDVINAVETNIVEGVIPSRILGAHCPFNGTVYSQIPYEDFVLPNRERSYRIHPFYLRHQSLIRVQFRNGGLGRILVCMSRGAEASRSCQSLTERDTHTFNITKPCPSPEFCPPIRFSVNVETTNNLCANNDCRLPSQVIYYMRHEGLRCLPLAGGASSFHPSNILHFIIVISFFYLGI